MKTVSGVLHISKTERKQIETLLEHCKMDINNNESGTFVDKLKITEAMDLKEVKNALAGIENIKWILEVSN